MGTLAFTTKSGQSLAAERVAPLSVVAKPTGWRAPGVAVTVGGFAGSGARVLLRADGRVVATTTAGKLGRYRLRFVPRDVRAHSGSSSSPKGSCVPPGRSSCGPSRSMLSATSRSARRSGRRSPRTAAPTRGRSSARTLREPTSPLGNLETAVSTRGVAAVKEFTFRGPPAALVADARRRRLRRAHAREQPHGRLRPRTRSSTRSRPYTPPGSRRSAPGRTRRGRAARRSSRPAASASRSSATPTSIPTASPRARITRHREGGCRRDHRGRPRCPPPRRRRRVLLPLGHRAAPRAGHRASSSSRLRA